MRYTREQLEWMYSVGSDLTSREMAEAFNERFERQVTPKQMCSWCRNHGVTKSAEARYRSHTKYTPEQLEFIRRNTPGKTIDETRELYRRRYGEDLSRSAMKAMRVKLGVHSGINPGHFEKGGIPWTKGKTWDEIMPPEHQERCRATQFKQGEISGVAADVVRPMLDVRVDPRTGYKQIKVNPRDKRNAMGNWMPLSHFEWERHNCRPWPEGCIAIFADHDPENMDPENIVPVPKSVALHLREAHSGITWHDMESLQVAIAHSKLTSAIWRAEEKRKRRNRGE